MTGSHGRWPRAPWWLALASVPLGAVLVVALQRPAERSHVGWRAAGDTAVQRTLAASVPVAANARRSVMRAPTGTRGRVISASGAAISAALICRLPPGGACCTLEQCTPTDERGEFWLDAGEAVEALVASAPGYRSRQVPAGLPAKPAAEEVVIELAAGGVDVSGVVSDASGGVVAGALVSARDRGEGVLVATAVSTADGRFVLSTPPGDLELVAEAPAYSRASRTAHAPERDIALVMAQQSSVRGQVLELTSRSPLAGVRVVAVERGGGLRPPQQVLSDDAGSFELSGLTAGTYELAATAAAWRGQPLVVDVAFGEALDAVEILAIPATTLAVKVELDAEPCPTGSVEVSGPAAQVVHLDGGGSADIEGLVPGRYLVSYNCVDAQPGRPALSLGGERTLQIGSEPQRVTFEVTRSDRDTPRDDGALGEVRVSVRGDTVALGSVILASTARGRPLRGETSGRGFRFTGLPLGVHTAFFERAPAVRATVTLEHAGQAVEATLVAPAARVITGRVVDADGQPAPDVWVRARNSYYPSAEFAAAGSPALTDAQGEFSIEGLFEQTYELTAEGLGAIAELDAVAGGARGVTLRLRPELHAPMPSGAGEALPE